MNLLVLGFGYSAAALVRLAAGRFARIDGTVRSVEKAALLTQQGNMHIYDGGTPSAALRASIAAAEIVLVTAAPGEAGDPFLIGLGNDLGAAPKLRLVQYLSTVGVYGDAAGGWVDEETPVNPPNRRGLLRVSTERAWQDFGRQHEVDVQIHRLAGIYGPGRNALIDLANGTARRIDKPGQVFNRIHVDDIAGALLAGTKHGSAIFNICDDEPAPASEVVAFAADLVGIAPPPLISFEQAGLSEMGMSFYSSNKRCSNAKVKSELGLRLRYPTYREALKSLFEAGEGRSPADATKRLARRPLHSG